MLQPFTAKKTHEKLISAVSWPAVIFWGQFDSNDLSRLRKAVGSSLRLALTDPVARRWGNPISNRFVPAEIQKTTQDICWWIPILIFWHFVVDFVVDSWCFFFFFFPPIFAVHFLHQILVGGCEDGGQGGDPSRGHQARSGADEGTDDFGHGKKNCVLKIFGQAQRLVEQGLACFFLKSNHEGAEKPSRLWNQRWECITWGSTFHWSEKIQLTCQSAGALRTITHSWPDPLPREHRSLSCGLFRKAGQDVTMELRAFTMEILSWPQNRDQ